MSDTIKIARHPGPFVGPDAELARAAAMAVIPWYGDDDETTHQRILKDGVWNDHVAVQAALAAIHHLKASHDRRVTELLEANTREVERRREAEATIDDMIVSATRYCIGRMSYIVGSCDGWLRKWWPHLGAGTRDVILRDIQAALEQERLGRRSLGHQIDIDTWAALYRDFSPGGKDHVTPFDRQGGSPNGREPI